MKTTEHHGLGKQESQTPITFLITTEDAPGQSTPILKPCLSRSNSFLVYLYPAGDAQSPCHHIPTLTFKSLWELKSEFMWITHICWDGEYLFFLAPHVNYSPLWAVQNCFSRAARNTAALSEQIKGEVPNPVVLEKREISASQQLFAALVQPGWGIINHCGAPAKSSAPPHAPVCQRSRILLKQHLVNIQIPGNSHTPCCHTGFLRLWFPMCSSQSWTLFFQLVGRQLLERLERQALGKDMGTLQHFHETAVRQAPSTSQQHDMDAGKCMATWPLAGLATPQSQEWNLKTEHSILPFVYPNLPRPSSNVQLRNSFHYFV